MLNIIYIKYIEEIKNSKNKSENRVVVKKK